MAISKLNLQDPETTQTTNQPTNQPTNQESDPVTPSTNQSPASHLGLCNQGRPITRHQHRIWRQEHIKDDTDSDTDSEEEITLLTPTGEVHGTYLVHRRTKELIDSLWRNALDKIKEVSRIQLDNRTELLMQYIDGGKININKLHTIIEMDHANIRKAITLIDEKEATIKEQQAIIDDHREIIYELETRIKEQQATIHEDNEIIYSQQDTIKEQQAVNDALTRNGAFCKVCYEEHRKFEMKKANFEQWTKEAFGENNK